MGRKMMKPELRQQQGEIDYNIDLRDFFKARINITK